MELEELLRNQTALIARVDCNETQINGLLYQAAQNTDRIDGAIHTLNELEEFMGNNYQNNLQAQIRFWVDEYLRELIEGMRISLDKELEDINLEDFELILNGG